MMAWLRKRPLTAVIAAFALGVLVVIAAWAGFAAGSSSHDSGANGPVGRTSSPTPYVASSGAPSTGSAAPPSGALVSADCSAASVTVATAADLTSALAAAKPGAVIALANGTYTGQFVATASGTASAPITLCGGSGATLDGGSMDKGYVFHLDHASYWRLSGFSVTNGQKGVVADGTVGSVIEGLTVSALGDEGIHLRDFSTDNTVTGNTVSDTGHHSPKFGEGIYIGTATSNWCSISDCKPDNSDRNVVEKNRISATTAESVDIKEGTSDGILRDNQFDGSGITKADSWVDVKGNGWTITGNRGANSPNDGFQTHSVVDGWGTRNVFADNVADVEGPGFGFSFTPALSNVLRCSNTASNAGEGIANVSCSSA